MKFVEIKNCNSKFTFDAFVIGDGNNFSYSAAKAVSKDPGAAFNPLFIYGGTGLGKTHLIQAAAHEVVKRKKNFKAEYSPLGEKRKPNKPKLFQSPL